MTEQPTPPSGAPGRPLIVAVLFETSGQVRRAFAAAGCRAYSVDILPAQDASPDHFVGDVRDVLAHWHAGHTGPTIPPLPDLAIAHPSCTYLCNSGVSRLHRTPPNPTPGVPYGEARWQAMRDAAELVAAVWNAPVPRMVIENPIMHGKARAAIHTASMIGKGAGFTWQRWHAFGAPTQTIQPYQFGDDASKRTALWMRGVEPLNVPDRALWVPPRIVAGRPRWGNQTDSGQNKMTPSPDRGLRRADTYPGIARAMAARWSRA